MSLTMVNCVFNNGKRATVECKYLSPVSLRRATSVGRSFGGVNVLGKERIERTKEGEEATNNAQYIRSGIHSIPKKIIAQKLDVSRRSKSSHSVRHFYLSYYRLAPPYLVQWTIKMHRTALLVPLV